MNYKLVLPNGFTLLGEPLENFHSAAFTLRTGAGSAWDPVGKYGMAAFVCEMMLRGAGEKNTRQFLEAIDRIGIDRTESLTPARLSFRAAMLAENLEDALELYADMICRPILPEKELEAGRQVLLQEVSSLDDDPESRLGNLLEEQFYGPAWGHDVDGVQEDIEKITWNDVRSQYEKLVMPNQCVMAVAGNFDWEKIAQKIESLFGEWKPKEKPEIPPFAAEKRPVHIPFDSPQTQIGLVWETVPYMHPDRLRAWAAISVLSGGMNSRLFNEVREKRGLCYYIDANCGAFRTRAGVFCTAGCKTENAQETLDVIRGEINRLADGVTEEELCAYKARCRTALVLNRETCPEIADDMISDFVNVGRIQTTEEILETVEKLSVSEINEYVASHPVQEELLCSIGREPLHL